MISIPPQIQEGWRFIKVMEDQKLPVEKDWQNTNNYSYKEFQDYMKIGTNYGVLPPTGKCVIDIDKKSPEFEEANKAAETLPETFTVQTANGGYHYYYNCPDIEKGIRLRNEAGEIRTNGMFVVGPWSELTEGKKYFPTKFMPVATTKKTEIEKAFAKWLPVKTENEQEPKTKQPKDKTKSGIEFGIVCRQIKKGKTKEQVFAYMNAYKKWADAHPQYRECTYNKALERVELIKKKGIGYIDGTFVPKALGDAILEITPIKTLKGNNTMYRYENGLYVEDGKEYIKELCAEILGDRYHTNQYNETLSYIQATTYINPTEIDNEWINLENGLLNPITKEFREHDPEIFSIVRIPIEYNPNATCPTWEEKLKEKLDEQTAKVVQEMFGYCYLPKQRYETAFLLYGPMRTMKSTTLYLLEQMLGDENVTAYQIQWLAENPFGAAYLYGKMANICPDLSTKALRDTGAFMSITGGDKISSAKKHEHPISFYPSSKLIFSCNNIPPTTNKNLAFYRRWIILEFKKQHANPDPSVREKLKEELPGILNWSLQGLERLIKKDGFSYWLDEMQVKDLYERGSDSIQSFIYNFIDTENDESVLKKREVYAAYKEYCLQESLKLENQIFFGRLFISLTGCGNCKVDKIPGYQGVDWIKRVEAQKKIL